MGMIRKSMIVAGVASLVLGIVAGAIYYWPENVVLRRCDNAIMAQLKAPATYNRISSTGTMVDGRGLYEITYDAENSFGVPLRSHGWCSVDWPHDKVTWDEIGSAAS